MSGSLADKIRAVEPLSMAVCAELNRQILKLGFPAERANVALGEHMQYSLQRDTFSGHDSLLGVWMHPTSGYKLGSLLIHPDGNFFAEYDVLQPHPSKRKWFVEAVTAWGKDGDIKGDPRLLPALED
ncbi:MAG: hypothetical protein HZT40_10065 [Candidatus Thiothrix singaporensis]|uniref:Uncharacterized protein n=1 Tax=Candidatus Thiothrix singaporensis TaxID=2799669 RepID=A0A7L6ARY4_9GAMM|nr:MAG: hypothetical protein HZT40_10065 [Candidatus Thiothrix singaporensis]